MQEGNQKVRSDQGELRDKVSHNVQDFNKTARSTLQCSEMNKESKAVGVSHNVPDDMTGLYGVRSSAMR